jgi:phage terminase large subunit-like protein
MLATLTAPARRNPFTIASERLDPESPAAIAERAARSSWDAMPHQLPPAGDWDVWILLGGRGAGKTDAGAHYVDDHARGDACLDGPVPHRVAIIAPSHDDAVKTCVRGESGLLQVGPGIRFSPGAKLTAALTWPNGSEAELFGAFTPEDPERLRGPQHCLIWGDEFAAWRKLEDVWNLAEYGLRLGPHPRWILTTTPKRRAKLKELLAEATTVMTTAPTSANPHLPADRKAKLYARYGGTTLGRQELEAQLIEDVAGALWKRDIIRYRPAPMRMERGVPVRYMARIVVAIDPAVTSGEKSDESGIVAAGLGHDGRGYVLEDVSGRMTPQEWAQAAISLYHRLGADRIVAEANNGGDLVSTVIRAVDPQVSIDLVHAARGKRTRAEPVAALYEQDRISHVAPFPELEDQQCSYTGAPGEDSPDRMDAAVWALSELFSIKVDDKAWGAGPTWGAS